MNSRWLRAALSMMGALALVALPAALIGGSTSGATAQQSYLNSTSTPLAAGATYTGGQEEMLPWVDVFVSVYAEPATAAGTLYIDLSNDGTNYDRTLTYVIANPQTASPPIRIGRGSKFFRVRYANGAVEQDTLRLTTLMGAVPTGGLSVTKNTPIGYEWAVAPTRNISDIDLDRARQKLATETIVRKFGSNPLIGTSEEDIWGAGGIYPFPSAAVTLRVKSGGSADDAAAGTGAQEITVECLDDDWETIFQSVATAGASASANFATDCRRVVRSYVSKAGAYTGANVADVVIESTAGVTLSHIAAGVGQSQQLIYTVPAGKTGYVQHLFLNGAGSKPITVKCYQRQNADDVTTPYSARRIWMVVSELSGPIQKETDFAIGFPAKTDIWCSGVTPSATSAVDGSMNIALVDN